MYSVVSRLITLSLLLIYFENVNGQQSSTYQAEAKFTEYATGSLSVLNGHLMVDIDVSGVDLNNENVSIPSNCFNNGVYYHIHTEWNHDDMLDKQGPTDCGNAQTGGHWDPWFACSDHSDGVDCKVNGGCIWGSSVVEVNGSYQCDQDDWDEYAFACEVADLTGKYGKATVKSKKISDSSSHWLEIDGEDFQDGSSIVFHCSDDSKTRAFCAPFNVTMLEDYGTYERETGNDKASINFNDIKVDGVDFDGTKITFGEGYVTVEIASEVANECETWFVRIYDEWNHDSSSSKSGDMCNMTYTGGVWDPTHSCIDDSGSMHCTDGTRCPGTTATDVDYDCDNSENALYCAHGDIIGRIEEIDTGGDKFSQRFEDRISIQVGLLADKSVVLTCTDGGSDLNQVNVCTKISNSDLSLASSSSSASDAITAGGVFGILMVIILFIAIGAGFIKGKQTEDQTKNVALVNRSVSSLGTGGIGTNTSNNNNGQEIQAIHVPTSVKHGEKSPQYGSQAQNDNTTMTINSNNLAVNNDRAIEVGEFSPSPSPAVGPDSAPHDPPAPPTPQDYETAGKLPPPVPQQLTSSNTNDNSYNNNSNSNMDDDTADIDLMDNNGVVTKGGGMPAPPQDDGTDNEDDGGQREDTPDQPMTDFEDEHGQLSIDEIGDPRL